MAQPSRLIRSLFYALFAVCPILFFTDLTRNPYYTQIALLNILVAVIWTVWLAQAWKRQQWEWVSSPLDLPLGALLLYSLVSWAVSFYQHPAFLKSIYSEGSRAAIFLLLNTWLVYAAALRLRDQNFLQRLLWLTYVVSVVAAVYGVAQYFGIEWVWPHQLNPYGSRPVSTFGNPNFLSSFLVVIIPVMVGDFLFKSTGWPRAVLFLAIVACVSALLATLTRSSWIGLVAGLMVLAIGVMPLTTKSKTYSHRAMVFLAIVFFGFIAFWPRSSTAAYSTTVAERFAEIRRAKEGLYGPVSQRFLIWMSAWGMVVDHPLMGKGWGCFELFYPFYQGPQLLEPYFQTFRTHANNSHNEILEYWSQLGTIGLGLLFWVWATFFRMAPALAKRQDPNAAALHWGLVGGVAGMLVDNLLNVSIHFAVPALLFWWCVGLVFARDPGALTAVELRLSGWRRALPLIGMGVLLLLAGRAYCMWRGEISFFEGFKRSKAGDLAAAEKSLRNAFEWHHLEVNNNYELGNVYARMGDRLKAMEMYQHALDANAGYDEIYFNRATMEAQTGMTDRAIDDYRKTLAINPMAHDAYNALATLYMKDFPRYMDDTERLYRIGVRVYPQDRDLWNNLGYVYTKKGNWPEAFTAYHRALEIDPEFDKARANMAIVLQHLPERANDPLFTLGKRYAEIDQLLNARHYDEARVKTDAVCALVPASFRAWFYKGNVEFYSGHFEAAAAAFRRSLELQPSAPTTWQNLGVTLDRLGQTAEAEKAYRKALEFDPSNTAAKARLGLH